MELGELSAPLERMGLAARRSLYAVFTDCKTPFLTSPHPQLFVNMQFVLVQSSHLAGISRELTRISIGGALPRWMGRMGLVARRSLYDVSIDWRITFLTGPHLCFLLICCLRYLYGVAGDRCLPVHNRWCVVCTNGGFAFSVIHGFSFRSICYLNWCKSCTMVKFSRESEWIFTDDHIRRCRRPICLPVRNHLCVVCTNVGFAFFSPLWI